MAAVPERKPTSRIQSYLIGNNEQESQLKHASVDAVLTRRAPQAINVYTPSASSTCNVSCALPLSGSMYFAFDASGSMNNVDITYNASTVSRAYVTDLLLNTYSTTRHADVRGGTLRVMTDKIKDGIQQAPLNSKVCSVIFITDATDTYGGVTAVDAWTEIIAELAGKTFKLDVYTVGFLGVATQGSSSHQQWLTMINNFVNTKPPVVNNFQYGVYSAYDTAPTSTLSQLMGTATGYICECDNSQIVRVSSAGGVTLNDAIDTAKSICC